MAAVVDTLVGMARYPRPAYRFFTRAAVVALLAALGAIGCEQERGNNATQPAENRAPADNAQSADEATRTLSGRLDQALNEGQDTEPLLEPAQELVAQYPDYAPAHTLCAQVLLIHGRQAEAYEHVQTALELNPKQGELRLLAGTVAMQLDKANAARTHYRRAVELEPSNGRYRLHLAQSYIAAERYDEARLELHKALKHDWSLDKVHAALADVHAQQGRTGEALASIRDALSVLPSDPDLTRKQRERKLSYVRQRSRLLRRDLNPADALSVLRDLPQAKQYTPAVSADMAACWQMLGEPIKAAEHYQAALERSSAGSAAAAGAARWYLKADKPKRAEAMIDELQRLAPRHEALSELRQQVREALAQRGLL